MPRRRAGRFFRRRRSFFRGEDSLSTSALYDHLLFRGVEREDRHTLELEFVLGRRLEEVGRERRKGGSGFYEKPGER